MFGVYGLYGLGSRDWLQIKFVGLGHHRGLDRSRGYRKSGEIHGKEHGNGLYKSVYSDISL